jgi:hypothetical protein
MYHRFHWQIGGHHVVEKKNPGAARSRELCRVMATFLGCRSGPRSLHKIWGHKIQGHPHRDSASAVRHPVIAGALPCGSAERHGAGRRTGCKGSAWGAKRREGQRPGWRVVLYSGCGPCQSKSKDYSYSMRWQNASIAVTPLAPPDICFRIGGAGRCITIRHCMKGRASTLASTACPMRGTCLHPSAEMSKS